MIICFIYCVYLFLFIMHLFCIILIKERKFKMNVLRTEKHLIKCTNLYYSLFCDYAHRSNNLFNYANYIIRNEFINNGR